MSINNSQPDFVPFIRNEFKTLKFLKDQPYLIDNFKELNNAANQFYNLYNNRVIKDAGNFSFNFESNFNLYIEGKMRQVFIGAVVGSRFSQVSYMLAFCKSDKENSKLIRKYHFDYETNINNKDKPLYHIQFGGKLTPSMLILGLPNKKIQSWLSIPRMNFTPMNLALLLDLVFVEFKSPITNNIVERREWRELIKTNEDLMLTSYYNSVNNFFTRGNHRVDKLFRDFSYGK